MKLIIKNASVSFGANEILKNVNFEISDNEKIAIVGRNGCGKTTLLKLICGEVEPDKDISGESSYEVNFIGNPTIGYLEQISFEDENKTLEDEVLKLFINLLKIKERLEFLEKQLEKNPTEKIMNDYIAAQHNFEIMGGYTIEKEYNQAIKKFGFSEEDRKKKICEFSGGQKTKIALIKLLFIKPDILILDEPTNHLDMEAINWLEEYLKNYNKAIILVSHDRAFVDNVASVVYEIENKTTHKYVGNYTKFVTTKKEVREKQLKEHEAYLAEVKRLQTLADKFRYKATKASMAQSKLKQIERMEVVDAPETENVKNFHFKLKPENESGLEVLKLENLIYGYDRKIGEISAKIYRGNKVAIVGGNGLGKSTLLKTIMGKVDLLGGKIKFGQGLEIGYFDQQTISLIASEQTVIENFMQEFPLMSTLEVRKHLGAFLFVQEDVFKKINSLSGGERVRLELAKIFKRQPNFLILDEPTNHLDIAGRETLEDMLMEYEGTILFVSHDRYFVKKIATGIIELTQEECIYHKDTSYDDFLKKQKKAQSQESVCKESGLAKEKQLKQTNNYKQTKDQTKKIAKLERDIKKLEEQIEFLNAEYYLPENCSNAGLLLELQQKIEASEEELNLKMEEWLNLVGE